MKKSVTLADIGKELGVSTVTVSKALSGQKGVSEPLREKIRKLADDMATRDRNGLSARRAILRSASSSLSGTLRKCTASTGKCIRS